MNDNLVLILIIIDLTCMHITDKFAPQRELTCNEPNVIAVEETNRGVVVRCGPVEAAP